MSSDYLVGRTCRDCQVPKEMELRLFGQVSLEHLTKPGFLVGWAHGQAAGK